MRQVVIENPIINSPFDEPTRRFRFNDEEISDGGRLPDCEVRGGARTAGDRIIASCNQ
jgi:hypothetical protein